MGVQTRKVDEICKSWFSVDLLTQSKNVFPFIYMSLFITSLNSGSNGNCYYIGNHTEAILIDAGISCRETERRMHLLGLTMKTVKGIFISHEHSDHIRGVAQLAKKYSLPVYVTTNTFLYGNLNLIKTLACNFTANQPVFIGGLSVTAFQKLHDAADPHSFIVTYNGITVGIFTDIGNTCNNVIHHFSQCHAAFLEANYDEVLLENGRYPIYLKNRIRGGQGHLSNRQALELFTKHHPSFMSHLLLSHLSKENNCPQLVQQLFDKYAGGVEVIVASRYKQTAIYTIQKNDQKAMAIKPPPILSMRPVQLNLF